MAENPMSEKEFKTLRRFIKPFSHLNVFVYKLTGGRLMGKLTGRPVMLVTMTGAKSGKRRTIPLMYVPYKEGVILVASQGGEITSFGRFWKLQFAQPGLRAAGTGTESAWMTRPRRSSAAGVPWRTVTIPSGTSVSYR